MKNSIHGQLFYLFPSCDNLTRCCFKNKYNKVVMKTTLYLMKLSLAHHLIQYNINHRAMTLSQGSIF